MTNKQVRTVYVSIINDDSFSYKFRNNTIYATEIFHYDTYVLVDDEKHTRWAFWRRV